MALSCVLRPAPGLEGNGRRGHPAPAQDPGDQRQGRVRMPDVWDPGRGHWLTGKGDTSRGLARGGGGALRMWGEGRGGLGLEP